MELLRSTDAGILTTVRTVGLRYLRRNIHLVTYWPRYTRILSDGTDNTRCMTIRLLLQALAVSWYDGFVRLLRKFKEKAPCFSAGMNLTYPTHPLRPSRRAASWGADTGAYERHAAW